MTIAAGAGVLPIIDVGPLIRGDREQERVARELAQSCRDYGFFYVVGHGVDPTLERRLKIASAEFFDLPTDEKMAIAMEHGGRAWRGYFPVGAELTSGSPDQKEGLYFGQELSQTHPLVAKGTPLHGSNLFPRRPESLSSAVLEYIERLTALGHRLMAGLALGLGLPEGYFADCYTADPLVLFRIFHYPRVTDLPRDREHWGVGEHTDYGFLTILKQDESGGLEVRVKSEWIAAPPVPGSFVCNLGDMLDRLTGGYYRSTPHRVRVQTQRNRFSFPFFFDPNYFAQIRPLPRLPKAADDKSTRWDHQSVHEFSGTYGQYLVDKVSRVFPQLKENIES